MKLGSALRTWTVAFAIVLLSIATRNVSAAPEQTFVSEKSIDVERQPLRKNAANTPATTRPSTQKAVTRPTTAAKGFNPSNVAISLGVVLVLILLLRWGAKRFMGINTTARASRAVQVLSRSPLTPRQQLIVLRVGKRLLVVADGGTQINTLCEIHDADEVATILGQLQGDHETRSTTTFGNLFGKWRGTYDQEGADPAPELPKLHPDIQDSFTTAGSEEDPSLEATRKEMSGLMDRVRTLARQFKTP